MAIRRVDDLEIDQDLAFVRRAWVVQRAGWIAMGLLLALAVAGVLGSGPLSRRQVTLPGLLRVDYERFTRYEAPQTLTVHLEPAATRAAEVRLWIDRPYLDDAKVEAIIPSPVRTEAAGDRLLYVFPMSRPGEPVTISFGLQSKRIGPGSARIGLAGADGFVSFRQFVYP